MFRKIANHKCTAAISNKAPIVVTCMYDDGWETLIDCRHDFGSEAEARAWLAKGGYEEYDPNAALKAKGFVWNGYCYAKP